MTSALRPARWNLLRAAALGATIVTTFSLFNVWQDGVPYPVEYWIGTAIGGVIGGAVLFGLAAGVRNLLVRAV